MPMGVSWLPGGTTAGPIMLVEFAVDGITAMFSELSCHLIHTRLSLHSLSAWSPRDARAMKMSERTPVGMSHMKVSRFFILARARATNVPSILPLSLVIMYSATQSLGPLPSENFLVYWAYSLPMNLASGGALG